MLAPGPRLAGPLTLITALSLGLSVTLLVLGMDQAVAVLAACFLLLAGFAVTVRIINRTAEIVYLLVIWIFAQDFLIMLVSQVVPSSTVQWTGNILIGAKELLAVGTVAVLWLRRKSSSKNQVTADRLAMGLICYVAMFVIIPNQFLKGATIPLLEKIIAARGLAILPVLYLLGRWLPLRANDLNRFIRFLMIIGAVSLFSGIVLTALPASVWHQLGLYQLCAAKWGAATARILAFQVGGFPANFWFPDFPESIVPSPGIRRLSSLIVDPIASGLVFATLLLIAAAVRKRGRFDVWMLLFGVGTLLTFSRGGMLVTGMGYVFLKIKRLRLGLILGIVILLSAFSGYSILLPFSVGISGTLNRGPALLGGLAFTLDHPMGRGIGSSGFLTRVRTGAREGEDMLEREGLTPFALESFVGIIGLQTGIIGILLFLGFLVKLISRLYQVYVEQKKQDPVLGRTGLAMAGVMAGLLLTSIVSSSGYGFAGVGLAYLLAGLTINQSLSAHTASPSMMAGPFPIQQRIMLPRQSHPHARERFPSISRKS